VLKILLYPFSLLYGLITDFRNVLFDKGFKSQTGFDIPIINVGNLTVGGTGKSPQIEYLIRLLADTYQVASLSRGYGRKTKGYILADEHANAEQIGDEPMQFFQKFGSKISVAVSEKRVEGVQQLLQEKPTTELILLDDAYQHRYINPSFNILLMDYNRPFYEDLTFPAGRLRERRRGAKRADCIVVSKCPENLDSKAQDTIKQQIKPYPKEGTPIFFSTIRYGNPISCIGKSAVLPTKNIVLVTGIANPLPFENYVAQQFTIQERLVFKDHHAFSEEDVAQIKQALIQENTYEKSVIMTEKDSVKFKDLLDKNDPIASRFFYIPIEIDFLNQERDVFNNLILAHCAKCLKTKP
jgi:tetraacyldisaccharide 4'-kinase